MFKKKVSKVLAVALLSTMVVTGLGVGGIQLQDGKLASSTVAYAQEQMPIKAGFNPNKYGLLTELGWATSKVRCENNIAGIKDFNTLKNMSVPVTRDKYPKLFGTQMGSNPVVYVLYDSSLCLTDTVLYSRWTNNLGEVIDDFYKALYMEDGKVFYAFASFVDGEFATNCVTSTNISSRTITDVLNAEKSGQTPTTPTEPTNPTTPSNPTPIKTTYTSTRLGGANRFTTATQIAKSVNSQKVDAVVLANAFNFPDALSGSVLASKYNAPILLVDKNASNNKETINYIKSNLKSTGKVYLLGDTGVVPDSVVKSLKSAGFSNFERLGGKDRYATNLVINKKINPASGSNIVVASSTVFADSLSVSGVAGKNQMPIYLTSANSITSETLNAIKGVKPKNIYIVGGTGAVSPNVEKSLKGIGNVVRIGGANRFETSLNIAKYFKQDTTVGVVANGLNFPDALAGSVLASKYNAPIFLVGSDVKAQKTYIDSTKIKTLYILGGTGVVPDSLVSILKK